MKCKLLAFLAILVIFPVAFAHAQIGAVQLYLAAVNTSPTGGTWQLYAADSDNNDGLANWDIDVIGANGAAVNSPATNEAPQPVDPSHQYADGSGGSMGFSEFVNSGFNSGAGRYSIVASQNTAYAGNDDPTFDMGILVGVGQEDSSASPQNGTQGPINGSGNPTGIATPVWNYLPAGSVINGFPTAGTLIEQGAYTTNGSPAATLSVQVDGFVEVLGTNDNGMNEPWGLPPYQLQFDTPAVEVTPDTITLPEPATLGLLAIGFGILSARARAARRGIR